MEKWPYLTVHIEKELTSQIKQIIKEKKLRLSLTAHINNILEKYIEEQKNDKEAKKNGRIRY